MGIWGEFNGKGVVYKMWEFVWDWWFDWLRVFWELNWIYLCFVSQN